MACMVMFIPDLMVNVCEECYVSIINIALWRTVILLATVNNKTYAEGNFCDFCAFLRNAKVFLTNFYVILSANNEP